jgi:hypothetical protein
VNNVQCCHTNLFHLADLVDLGVNIWECIEWGRLDRRALRLCHHHGMGGFHRTCTIDEKNASVDWRPPSREIYSRAGLLSALASKGEIYLFLERQTEIH